MGRGRWRARAVGPTGPQGDLGEVDLRDELLRQDARPRLLHRCGDRTRPGAGRGVIAQRIRRAVSPPSASRSTTRHINRQRVATAWSSIVGLMSELMTADRRATAGDVAAKRAELRTLASRHRFDVVNVTANGMIVVHTDDPGYRGVARFAGEASRLVGAYVQVITDNVAAAAVPTNPL